MVFFFATTSYPFPEKARGNDRFGDYRFSRNGSCHRLFEVHAFRCISLGSALDAVAGGSARRVMVVAADCRMGEPGSDEELILGDGSASLQVGDTNVIANKVGHFSISDDFTIL